MNYDVVTLGETMVRFTPPGLLRLEQATTVEMHAGGSESNTAVGLARLGARVAWISRLTSNPLGRFIATQLAAQGVDVSHIAWTDQDRVGTFFLERGKPPRGSSVWYDRKASAASRISPQDLPTDLFTSGRSRWFHTSGISLGISAESATTVTRAVERAKVAEWMVSFDLNYRAKLWTPAEARRGCEVLLRAADVVFLPRRDALTIYGIAGNDPAFILHKLASEFPNRLIVLTLGAEGAAAISASGEVLFQSAYATEEVERLGGGDAFAAGFLFSYMNSRDIADALRWGTATAALKYSIPGELPIVNRAEVEALIRSQGTAAVAR